jgi:hypothetical protein
MAAQVLTWVNLKEFEANLKRIGEAATNTVASAAEAGGLVIEGHIKDNIQKQHLIDTSNYVNSWRTRISRRTPTGATSDTFTEVVYGPIHEFGGVIKAKDPAGYLRFQTKDGAWHTVKSVTIPARPHVRPALDENKAEINDTVVAVLQREIERAIR